MSQIMHMKSMQDLINKRQHYHDAMKKKLAQVQTMLPGAFMKCDEEGITITLEGENLLHFSDKIIKCYVCGSAKTHIFNMPFSEAIDHLLPCRLSLGGYLRNGVCSVCDNHWIPTSKSLIKLDYDHISTQKHINAMTNARLKMFYRFGERVMLDETIMNIKFAGQFLQGKTLGNLVKYRSFVEACIEISLSGPEYSLGGYLSPYKTAIASYFGNINNTNINKIHEVLEKNSIAGNLIYEQKYGERSEDIAATAPPPF